MAAVIGALAFPARRARSRTVTCARTGARGKRASMLGVGLIDLATRAHGVAGAVALRRDGPIAVA